MSGCVTTIEILDTTGREKEATMVNEPHQSTVLPLGLPALSVSLPAEPPTVIGPPALALPRFTVSRIVADPDEYVQWVGSRAKELQWPTFNPKPEVVE